MWLDRVAGGKKTHELVLMANASREPLNEQWDKLHKGVEPSGKSQELDLNVELRPPPAH